jgi:hypothetical protein
MKIDRYELEFVLAAVAAHLIFIAMVVIAYYLVKGF